MCQQDPAWPEKKGAKGSHPPVDPDNKIIFKDNPHCLSKSSFLKLSNDEKKKQHDKGVKWMHEKYA